MIKVSLAVALIVAVFLAWCFSRWGHSSGTTVAEPFPEPFPELSSNFHTRMHLLPQTTVQPSTFAGCPEKDREAWLQLGFTRRPDTQRDGDFSPCKTLLWSQGQTRPMVDSLDGPRPDDTQLALSDCEKGEPCIHSLECG